MEYKNRIVGLEYIDSASLVSHPGNWRNHPSKQVEALRGVLADVGIADALLAYRSKRQNDQMVIIDGHLRKEAAPQKWPVLVLDVTDEEADYILATHDPLAAMAVADEGSLDALLSTVNSSESAVREMLSELAKASGLYSEEEEEENYSRKIEAPLYEPIGRKPMVSELFDDTKTQSLIQAINSADIPEEIRAFLIIASQRHTVFNFTAIAEFYAHSEQSIQDLFEKNALVLIDLNRAIELGFVSMTEEIARMYSGDYDN